jgi:hypothetical protein
MASVKAHLGNQNMDRDEQLVHLTSTLVRMWKETGSNLDIANLLH